MTRMFACGFLAAFLVAASGAASTVTVTVDHHMVVTAGAGGQRVLRAVFADEPLLATVSLDVYAVPQLPSTRAHLEALQKLSVDSWWQHLRWDVRDASGHAVDVSPRLMRSGNRKRGPGATELANRDTAVACSSYEAVFDLGPLPPGDFSVTVRVEGLESAPFPVGVRSGTEPEVREFYFAQKARMTSEWSEYKELQLERLRLDPTKAAALMELAERALVSGTEEEAAAYLERAADSMERNLAAWARVNPEDARQQAPSVAHRVAQMRALRAELADLFAHRDVWVIATDPVTGNYVIRSKRDGKMIREVEAPK